MTIMLIGMDDAARRGARLRLGTVGVCLAVALIGAACQDVAPASRVTRAPYLTAAFGD
jgi:hypothetical protein